MDTINFPSTSTRAYSNFSGTGKPLPLPVVLMIAAASMSPGVVPSARNPSLIETHQAKSSSSSTPIFSAKHIQQFDLTEALSQLYTTLLSGQKELDNDILEITQDGIWELYE